MVENIKFVHQCYDLGTTHVMTLIANIKVVQYCSDFTAELEEFTMYFHTKAIFK